MKHSNTGSNPSPVGGKITHPSVPNDKRGPGRGSSERPGGGKGGKGSVSKGGGESGCGGQRKGYGERGEGRSMGGGKEDKKGGTGGMGFNASRTPKP